jgi:tetratricopeptide (TPR) repeat protein/transcriptional regulator with XRE-family HTH domain
MAAPAVPPFSSLLQELRVQLKMSQEDLAERSCVSVRQISSLENGNTKWPRKETVRLLADALGLEGLAREKFGGAARGRVAGKRQPRANLPVATRVLPPGTQRFTGRQEELARLAALAREQQARGTVAVHLIDGMPGVGKTALATYAARALGHLFPDPLVFLSLAGHVAGRAPADPSDALAALLRATGMSTKNVPVGQDKRAELWCLWLAGKRLILLLDDAADSAQVAPLLPASGNCLVIITSRRRLIELADASTMTLDVLPPRQAAELLAKHADRPGLTSADAAVAEISRLCGRLPLAVGIVGRLLHHHPAWSPANLADDLSRQRDRLELMSTENLSVAAAFDLSYQRLGKEQQHTFRRLALHPGADIDAYAAAALDDSGIRKTSRHLEALYAQHLVMEPGHLRYRLHDLTREYAVSLAQNEDASPDRERALDRLLEYYQRAAEAADARLSFFTRPSRPTLSPGLSMAMPEIPDAPAAMAWLRAERTNLLACVTTALSRGEPDRAAALTAALASSFRIDGPWPDAIKLHAAAEQAARQAGNEPLEADAQHDLGIIQRMSGNYKAATEKLTVALGSYQQRNDALGAANAQASLSTVHRLASDHAASTEAAERALSAYQDLGDRRGQVNTLTSLGIIRYLDGTADDSIALLKRALDLAQGDADQRAEAGVLTHIGVANRLRGRFEDSAAALDAALGIQHTAAFEQLDEANTLMHLAMTRQAMGSHASATGTLEKALQIYQSLGDRLGQGNALTLLGPARYQAGDTESAFDCLRQAERILGDLGDKMGQGNALYYLGHLHRLSARYQESELGLKQAQALFGSLRLPGGTVVVLNELGVLHMVQDRLEQATAEHRRALRLARRIHSEGDEADALAGLGRCAQAVGRMGEARRKLEQALEIYRRIKSSAAAELDTELADLQPT